MKRAKFLLMIAMLIGGLSSTALAQSGTYFPDKRSKPTERLTNRPGHRFHYHHSHHRHRHHVRHHRSHRR
jgi:hypothetical protein